MVAPALFALILLFPAVDSLVMGTLTFVGFLLEFGLLIAACLLTGAPWHRRLIGAALVAVGGLLRLVLPLLTAFVPWLSEGPDTPVQAVTVAFALTVGVGVGLGLAGWSVAAGAAWGWALGAGLLAAAIGGGVEGASAGWFGDFGHTLFESGAAALLIALASAAIVMAVFFAARARGRGTASPAMPRP